ncbi:DUF86 domain-containing protein [bacterium]|nr:DUF86 domain-containing protein [bacterium]
MKVLLDHDLILSKAGSIKKHIKRIEEKRPVDLKSFIKDIDVQESILFNLQMAIQNCIDIAAHIVSEKCLGVPGSTNEMFYLLQENGYLDWEISEKMIKAVGFRNLIVHEYGNVELDHVFKIARDDIEDLNEYVTTVFKKLGIC